MVNSYYNVTGAPVQSTRGTSPSIRNEYALIQAGFDKLPSPASLAGGYANYAVDTGTVNAYAITVGSAVLSYTDGLTFIVKTGNANTAASTLAVNGLPPQAIVRQDGTALQANDILSIFQVTYNITTSSFVVTNNLLAASNAAAAAAAASATASAGSATASASSASAANTSAIAAAASATLAASYSAALQGNSATSLAIGQGAKSFTVTQTNRAWSAGQFLVAASAANNSNYMHGQITSYNTGTNVLVLNVLDIGGAGTFADWILTIAGTQGPQGPQGLPTTQTYVARTSNVQLVASNASNFIDVTSGTFTQTFDTPVNLGSGWTVRYRNSGTGNVTIPLSDSVSNYIVYPGEVRDFIGDGTTLRSVVINPYSISGTSSISFIPPPGYSFVDVYLEGAGGGGGSGGSSATLGSGAGGGGGGGCLQALVATSDAPAGTAIAITVGAFGAGGVAVTSANGNAGTTGGTTSFGSLLAANGGGGGAAGTTSTSTPFGGGGATPNYTMVSAAGTGGGSGAVNNSGILNGVVGGASTTGCATGGGGGGASDGTTFGDGAHGGNQAAKAGGIGGISGNANGANGAAGTGRHPGTGGGGGGSAIAGPGGNGGVGGRSSGGGGGGYGHTNTLSGAGGNGGSGLYDVLGVI